MSQHKYPAIHNAMWPGLVGKGPDSEPPIDLDTMLDLTAAAEVDGVKFDGVDLFLFDPHVSIDVVERRPEAARRQDPREGSRRRLARRAGVAADRRRLRDGQRRGAQERSSTQVRKACTIAQEAAATSASASTASSASTRPPARRDWAKDPEGNTKKIAETFREAADIAEGYGERLAAEGEICWGGMHCWQRMVELLETVGRPKTVGFQADMAHTLLYTMGYNAPEDRILPENYDW